ncbi:MAG: flavodoxin domain-containing protein [Candidatus Methylacidiphilales bacterium]|nr:flavodoxin domain-containing protein [Candidatus Methylacidiphilales bacterium]
MSTPITILFATTTGNAEDAANTVAAKLKSAGFATNLVSAANWTAPDVINFAAEPSTLLIVASTWGEGEPPDDAIPLWDSLKEVEGTPLTNLRFSLLALGDHSYEIFCGFGVDLDARLEALGATRISPRVDSDVDYDGPTQDWCKEVLVALSADLAAR